MKKIIAIGMVIVSALFMNIACLAKENDTFSPPTEILVEGGKLVLVETEGGERTVQPRYTYKVVTDGGNLNVRSGPGTEYSIIGRLANGSYFSASFMQDYIDWTYGTGTDVSGVEVTGYVSDRYLGDSGFIH